MPRSEVTPAALGAPAYSPPLGAFFLVTRRPQPPQFRAAVETEAAADMDTAGYMLLPTQCCNPQHPVPKCQPTAPWAFQYLGRYSAPSPGRLDPAAGPLLPPEDISPWLWTPYWVAVAEAA